MVKTETMIWVIGALALAIGKSFRQVRIYVTQNCLRPRLIDCA
jgi:hypothetical protein